MDDTGLLDRDLPAPLVGKSVVLVGLMGAGKTSVGRRLAARLGLPFRDADAEIEAAAGCTVSELFERHGEGHFRDGERRVVRRLLAGEPVVLATGGGAFMDPRTRAAVRAEAVSVWLRCPLPVLLRRTAGRATRPLLRAGDPAQILHRLMQQRHPVYAEADLVVECGEEGVDATTARVLAAVLGWRPPRRLHVALASAAYDVVIGDGLLARAGAQLAPVLASRRCVVVTDEAVAALHLPALLHGLAEAGIEARTITVPPGEASKSLAQYGRVVEGLLAAGVDRRTAVLALGGGVVGDLAGFAAATTLRGLPFVQVPTTLLAQVDSSVGGKTGVNTAHGKNLVGAFHQPRLVLADTGVLATLPGRELRAGYAEVVKAGLIGDAGFYAWCEGHAAALLGAGAGANGAGAGGGAAGTGAAGGREALAEAVLRACAFKAAVVGEDEREEAAEGGRALLNLGHTFGHALEAEMGYDGRLLHGEAVAAGLGLAFRLSARLGFCAEADAARVTRHLDAVALPSGPGMLNQRFSAERLIGHMRRDKKARDGTLRFVLARGIGAAFTADDVDEREVRDFLIAEGCEGERRFHTAGVAAATWPAYAGTPGGAIHPGAAFDRAGVGVDAPLRREQAGAGSREG